MVTVSNVTQIICVDPRLTHNELAHLVREGVARLTCEEILLPAREMVFRVLIKKLPWPGVTWRESR